ncbi:uncharacterized protein L3040_003842 [Drepanopeziza brunnea f. sp. 'multigermtubi']|uniref:Tyrosinase n=1 Tax=Marssonina brunnea f. sp. multigermtubi (strain MB_m1) TaxID=1072389 RepID=K1WC50_MARBU|nr:tyrosinase [Drepanopeziza brunnea f. sp. 'multigermtubi' MB_m1]EKD14960.1 tyrosinase [Drepanopeziza brunnea f. sp. 'multigermtubi' MB_m1]KAJ5046603.1 hypothetical protein L3040_003842 [Drepanopeziza brunnea f. sp. 'multigermtubi']
MRSSLLHLAAAAALSCSAGAAAATVPKAPALPASAFVPTQAKLLPFDDAKAGKDLVGLEFDTTHAIDLISEGSAADLVSSASAQSCAASPNMRFEWRSYSTRDRQALMVAIRCLMNRPPSGNFPPAANRYEDLVRLHQINTPRVHGNAIFLLWHRYYVWTFEQVLRAECGFNRAFPWWDETLDAGRFAQSTLFTQPYFGNLLPAQANGQGWCINSGAFGGITLNVGPGQSNRAHCLTRALNEQLTAQVSKAYVDLCNSRATYVEMASCAEGGPHAYGHNGIGAVMSDVAAAPNDPIFFMHHLFVDHGFRIWQNVRGATSVNGNGPDGRPLTLDTIIEMGGVRPNVPIRSIINTLGGVRIGTEIFCYRYNY